MQAAAEPEVGENNNIRWKSGELSLLTPVNNVP